MTVVVETSHEPFRVEQLLDPGMPEKFVEVIEGELVVMTPAHWLHNRVAMEFHYIFRLFCASRPGLDFGSDNDGFLLRRNPDVLLSPDASLFQSRLRRRDLPWMEFCPEIVVEVLSPSNNTAQIAYKRRKYFEAGAEQVWIADLEKRAMEFCFRDDRRVIVQGDEVVRGEGIADGMEIDLTKIFAVERT